MSALEWHATPRPGTEGINVYGPCSCGRRRYFHEALGGAVRCVGCDEIECACYCPPARHEAIP